LVWNLLDGGLDAGDPARLYAQLDRLATYQPDVLCLPECTWGDDVARYQRLVSEKLGLVPAMIAPSRVAATVDPAAPESPANYTGLFYDPLRLRLVGPAVLRGRDAFHHALIRAVLRPVAVQDDRADVLVLATHLNPFDPEAQLHEVRGWVTDYGGRFPGMPERAVLLGDLNTPDREPASWNDVPVNLHARYRELLPDNSFGGVDRRSLDILLTSGWEDPHTVLGVERQPTWGYYYDNEQVRWALDYALVAGRSAGLEVGEVLTQPWDPQFRDSDHLIHGVDILLPA
jgi:exodeoxyribonuclease-3